MYTLFFNLSSNPVAVSRKNKKSVRPEQIFLIVGLAIFENSTCLFQNLKYLQKMLQNSIRSLIHTASGLFLK